MEGEVTIDLQNSKDAEEDIQERERFDMILQMTEDRRNKAIKEFRELYISLLLESSAFSVSLVCIAIDPSAEGMDFFSVCLLVLKAIILLSSVWYDT